MTALQKTFLILGQFIGSDTNGNVVGFALGDVATGEVVNFDRVRTSANNDSGALPALVDFLQSLPDSLSHSLSGFTVVTNSKYLRDGYNSWIKSWKNNGWMTKNGTPVRNRDYWMTLDRIRSSLKFPLHIVYQKELSGADAAVDRVVEECMFNAGKGLTELAVNPYTPGKGRSFERESEWKKPVEPPQNFVVPERAPEMTSAAQASYGSW